MMLKTFFILLVLISRNGPVPAQPKPATAFQVKAAYLYNFTRFVEWEPDRFSDPDAPFVIGIVGNKLVGDYLAQIVKGETVENHPIVVQQYNSVSEARNCKILFLGAGEASRARQHIAEMNHKGILTVSDSENFLKWGGVIRFFNQDNKIRIQINSHAARTGQLQISSKLLNIAADY